MALTDMMPSFVWGAGGAQMTPEQIARERAIADALVAQGINTSPVGHWTQGLARVANAAAGAFRGGAADEAERTGRSDWQSRLASTLAGTGSGGATGATAPVAAVPAGAVSPVSSPMGATAADGVASSPDASMIREGLIKRGVPVPVADGFIMNFRDESGLNPGLNEAKPIVPGSRGGFGLAQWTGPRRVELEKFAQNTGRSVSDVDTQLDFLMRELQGPEAGAAKSFLSAKTPQEAAVAIAQNFLRPAPEHLARRVANYSGSAAPSAPSGGLPATADLLRLATDPFAPRGSQALIGSLMQHQMQQNDPLRKLQMQKLQSDIARTTGAGPGTQAFQTLHQRALAAGLQEGTPEYRDFMAAGGKSPESTAKAQQIARMEGIGVPRNVAIGIADGVYKADRHPVTGELQVVDMSTGRPIYGGPQQRRQEQTPQPVPFTGGSQQFGQQFENAPASFGLEGAARGLANTAFDVAGMPVPYRDVQQTQADFRVLQESLVNDLESAYSGRVPSWMLKNLRDLTPSPGSPFEGSETARTKLNAMGRQLQSELTITEQSLSRELSPKNRQDAEAKISALRSGISRVGAALQSFGAPPSSPQGQAAPQPGAVEDGYRFKGGNPADPNNWERVQ